MIERRLDSNIGQPGHYIRRKSASDSTLVICDVVRLNGALNRPLSGGNGAAQAYLNSDCCPLDESHFDYDERHRDTSLRHFQNFPHHTMYHGK